MLKFVLSLILFFLCPLLWAILHLNVSVYDKKDIDSGLTLASELHSLEEIREGQRIFLKMKTGIQIILRAHFEARAAEGVVGPSDRVLIRGGIYDKRGRILKDFTNGPLLIPLGQNKAIIHQEGVQSIELKIGPEIR